MIKQYDKVELKDGRIATVVEIFGEDTFIVDVGSDPEDWDTISVTRADVITNLSTGERIPVIA